MNEKQIINYYFKKNTDIVYYIMNPWSFNITPINIIGVDNFSSGQLNFLCRTLPSSIEFRIPCALCGVYSKDDFEKSYIHKNPLFVNESLEELLNEYFKRT
jgi:hypothetical protein